MFEWLEHEISVIKTPGFHSVDGPADAKLREAVTASPLRLPLSYQQFVLKFGNAKLYRRSRNGYRIGVFAGPREATLNDGTRVYHLGFHDGASVYVKPSSGTARFPIFEFEENFEEKVAGGFDEWLTASCTKARNDYDRKGWGEILRGPRPFTAKEREMMEARRLIRWKVLGIDGDGNHMLEIINEGSHSLPALTVGVRSKDGRLNGAVRLVISHIGPGQKAVLHTDCYKTLISPELVEVFALPEPKPEDRCYYWEFK
jgi:hypothetical protein